MTNLWWQSKIQWYMLYESTHSKMCLQWNLLSNPSNCFQGWDVFQPDILPSSLVVLESQQQDKKMKTKSNLGCTVFLCNLLVPAARATLHDTPTHFNLPIGKACHITDMVILKSKVSNIIDLKPFEILLYRKEINLSIPHATRIKTISKHNKQNYSMQTEHFKLALGSNHASR